MSILLDFNHPFTRKLFLNIVAFTQADFQLTFAAPFIMNFTHNVFILAKTRVESVIHEQQVLGAHTNIIVFESQRATQFTWTHEGVRPFGHKVPLQCSSCKCLKPWKAELSRDGGQIKHKCRGRNCKIIRTYNIPPEVKWIRSKENHNERGAWMSNEL